MPDSAPPAVTHHAAAHRFEAETPAGLAHADYELRGGEVYFTHTEVPEHAEGQGVGSALVRAALAWADAEGLAVVPVCPFFAAYVAAHPDALRLVPPHARHYVPSD